MQVPEDRIKNLALCVGVILGDALVTVGEADNVLDPEAVMLALSVAELEAVSETDSLALSLAELEAVSDTDSLALSLAVLDAVILADSLAV